MEEALKTAESIVADLTAFAREHNLVLPDEASLYAHAAKYVKLGHCPCDERRPNCPCDEAIDDLDEMGRCECGVLLDPMKLFENSSLNQQVDSKPD